MIQGAIFDLDGTLTDSMQLWDTVLTDDLTARGLSWDCALLQEIATMGLLQSARRVREIYRLPDSAEEITERWQSLVFERYANDVQPKPGAVQCVRELRKMGIPCCVATSNFRASTEAALRHIGLTDAFSRIFTADEVGGDKSRPDIYLAAADYLGVAPPHCLVAEDMPQAVRTAKQAGFVVCAVYDEISSRGAEKHLRGTADFYVRDLSEIPKRLNKE